MYLPCCVYLQTTPRPCKTPLPPLKTKIAGFSFALPLFTGSRKPAAYAAEKTVNQRSHRTKLHKNRTLAPNVHMAGSRDSDNTTQTCLVPYRRRGHRHYCPCRRCRCPSPLHVLRGPSPCWNVLPSIREKTHTWREFRVGCNLRRGEGGADRER